MFHTILRPWFTVVQPMPQSAPAPGLPAPPRSPLERAFSLSLLPLCVFLPLSPLRLQHGRDVAAGPHQTLPCEAIVVQPSCIPVAPGPAPHAHAPVLPGGQTVPRCRLAQVVQIVHTTRSGGNIQIL